MTAAVTERPAAEIEAGDADVSDAGQEALHVAFLEAVAETAKAAYEKARDDAEAAFAELRAKGNPQQEIRLGGAKIGLISIAGDSKKVTVEDEEKLLEFARKNLTGAIEQYIDPKWVSSLEVIEMVRDCFPGSVCERIRPETRRALVKQMEGNDGFVTIKGTGVTELLGTVKTITADGSFTLNGAGKEARRAALIDAWQRGELPAAVTGGLTLPSRVIAGAVEPAAALEAAPDDTPDAGGGESGALFGAAARPGRRGEGE